jgi:hypothetical protein
MFSHLTHEEKEQLIKSFHSIACSLEQLVEGQKVTNELLKTINQVKPRLVLTLGKPESQ